MSDVMPIQTTSDHTSTITAPPPPPPPTRRPRVREVSSRFMSPSPSPVTSSSSVDSHKSPLHRPNHHQKHHHHHRRHHHDSKEGESSGDENRPLETARSLDSPFQFQRRLQYPQPPPRSVKPFGENGTKQRSLSNTRPDTPQLTTPMTVNNFTNSKTNRFHQRSTTSTAASKLLQSLSTNQSLNNNNSSVDDRCSVASNDDNSSLCSLDMDSLASVSVTRVNCNGNGNVASSLTPFSRSLNLFSSRGSERTLTTPALSRSFSNSSKFGGMGGVGGGSLPPVPPQCLKTGVEVKKGGKKGGSGQQEDVHALKMLYNRYLQWRFANAKSVASVQAQRREAERMLYSLALKISDLYDSVKRKRAELQLLQRMKTLSTIVEAQMPYLDEWSAFEGDYTDSFSEMIQALSNVSLQLPIGTNVKADVKDIGDALNSSEKFMDMIISNIQCFLPKANEMETLLSELAKVTGCEKALMEECEVLLSNTQALQVEECSLRSQIMQIHPKASCSNTSITCE